MFVNWMHYQLVMILDLLYLIQDHQAKFLLIHMKPISSIKKDIRDLFLTMY